jgi:hypothetical protein
MTFICPTCIKPIRKVLSINNGIAFRNGNTWHSCESACSQLKLSGDEITFYAISQVIDEKNYLLKGWENKQHILEGNDSFTEKDGGETLLYILDTAINRLQIGNYKMILRLNYRVPLETQNDIDSVIPRLLSLKAFS